MAIITRWLSAILAVLIGLPTLVTAVFQSLTKIGYDERPSESISANFLEGSEDFINEAKAEYWSAGYARRVLTPDDIDSTRYFLGGFLKFPAQEATGVVDDLCVRAVVLDDNSGRGAAAFAWVDGVGFMNADIKEIRKKLSDITGEGKLISIDVGSTHCHSGIDTQGLWGNIPKSGRNQDYIEWNNACEECQIPVAGKTGEGGLIQWSISGDEIMYLPLEKRDVEEKEHDNKQ